MKDNVYVEYMDAYDILYKYGYSDEEIDKIISNSACFKYDNTKIGLMIDNSYKYLLDKGYSYEEIKRVVLSYPGMLFISNKKRIVIEELFFDIGMSFFEFKEFSLRCVNIYSYSKEKVCGYIDFFSGLGYDNKKIRKIFKVVPVIFRVSINNLNKFYNDMVSYGFAKEEIFNIGRNFPSFWSHNFNKVKIVIDTFIDIGFDKDTTKKIIKLSPSLIGYDKDTILRKFVSLMNLGFSREELKSIICVCPSLLTSSIDRTNDILCFFKEKGLYDKLLDNPKSFFMQSIESSYAKYCFYVENGIEINNYNYSRLFLDWKRFKERFGFSKEEMFIKYSYDEYKNNLGNKR